MKKRGFGQGYWNGFGGKVGSDETIEEAAKRELEEEAGVKPKDLTYRGVLTFEFLDDTVPLEMHVFAVSKIDSHPIESDEMAPQWFSLHDIPYDQMWADDQYWLPLLLAGKKFEGRFVFRDLTTLIKHQVQEVDHVKLSV